MPNSQVSIYEFLVRSTSKSKRSRAMAKARPLPKPQSAAEMDLGLAALSNAHRAIRRSLRRFAR